MMSGLSAPETASGPVLEKPASWSCLSTAPTVSADAAAARGGDRLGARVARGDHEERAVLLRQRVDRLGHRVGPVGGHGVAEAHVHDVGARLGGPLHARHHPRVLALAVGPAEHLADDQVGTRGDAPVVAVRGGAGADDRAGDVGAVPVDVGDRLAGDEAGGVVDLVRQVRVVDVDAGVEHRDGDARAVEAGRPRLGRADLRHALLQGRRHLAVEPELRRRPRRGSGVGSVRSISGATTSRTCGPPLVRDERRAVDRGGAGDHPLPRGARAGAAAGPRRGVYVTIVRHRPGLASSYPISIRSVTLNSRGSSRSAPRSGDGLVGDDEEVAAALLHAEAADGAVGPVDVGDLVAVGQRRDRDDVAGDQRDRHRRGRVRPTAAAGPVGPWSGRRGSGRPGPGPAGPRWRSQGPSARSRHACGGGDGRSGWTRDWACTDVYRSVVTGRQGLR